MFISIIELFGQNSEAEELSYWIQFDNATYFYKNEKVGRKEFKRVNKNGEEPSKYFIRSSIGYNYTGTNFFSKMAGVSISNEVIVLAFRFKVSDLKTYKFIFSDNGNDFKSKVEYIGYSNEAYIFTLSLNVPKEKLIDFMETRYIYVKLNEQLYSIVLRDIDGYASCQGYAYKVEREKKEREEAEYRYKNSLEYKRQVRQKSFESLIKNGMYDIKKDNFDSRIHVTSKRTSSKFDKNTLNILNKNNVFMTPRCEINSESYSPNFGMTITQKTSMTKGSLYIQGIGFSNGDESVIIRLNTVHGYTIGVVGKYININGYADGVQATVSIGYVNDLYNLMITAKKPIMVKIYAGEYSYETVISDLEKNMFIDILKINQLEGFKDDSGNW